MTSAIEAAIEHYAHNRDDMALRAIDLAIIHNDLLVPTFGNVAEIESRDLDVPVICLRTEAGDGAIPAFTSVSQLLQWKPEGCKYIAITGKKLVEMALGMPEISMIVLNVDGVPRGTVPRKEFERLISLG